MTPAIDYERYGLAETKDRFSALTAQANSTGRPFTVLKGGKPWVEVRPLAFCEHLTAEITITPAQRHIPVTDLDELFATYDGSYSPSEDGFAASSGVEEM